MSSRTPLAVPLVAVVLAAFAAEGVAAQRSLSVDSWRSQLRVEPSGDVDVTETITYRFDGSWNGVYRDVLVSGERQDGSTWRLFLDDVEAVDGRGGELRHETSREGDRLRIKVWVPEARNATRTVIFRYRVENALIHHSSDEQFEGEAFDELNWNVTGQQSRIPIRTASASVRLPEGASGVRGRAWEGPYGSTDSAAVTVEDGLVRASTTRRLAPHEGLTVAAAWDAGVVDRPGALARAGLWPRRRSSGRQTPARCRFPASVARRARGRSRPA